MVDCTQVSFCYVIVSVAVFKVERNSPEMILFSFLFFVCLLACSWKSSKMSSKTDSS